MISSKHLDRGVDGFGVAHPEAWRRVCLQTARPSQTQGVPPNAVNTWSIKRLVSVWPSFVSVLRSASAVLELWAAYVSCGAANLDDSYYYGGDRAHRAPPPNGPGTPQTGAAPNAAATP